MKSTHRAMALSNQLSKLLDYVIFERYRSSLDASDAQFVFKTGSSINHCSLVAKEVLRYYMQRESEPIACLLDLKKAFDRVNIAKNYEQIDEAQYPTICAPADYMSVQLSIIPCFME